MFKKLLIANRGEIALRILRACRELSIKTVAVHSSIDTDSLHVKFSDESVCVGPPDVSRSYLNIPAIMSAAEITGADAIHPGYGFLAENASFAEICEQCKLTFVGPQPDHIATMGNKWRARELALASGVPILPGRTPKDQHWREALDLAQGIGFPVMLKAAEGGGGKGIKIVRDAASFEQSFLLMQSEVKAAFGNADLYLEKFLGTARHVEVQILADGYGNMVHFGERECSVQRRFQKMVEETPSPGVTPELRDAIGEAALKVAGAVQYASAGTVEFLIDEDLRYYFLEMNTRIQVEHPITEMVSGVDLIKEQIRIAAGEPLRLKQAELAPRGHAIECRITAEDSDTLRPSSGLIQNVHVPGGNGIRMDSAIYAGYTVTAYYDSLLAKLCVHATDRREALAKMRRALLEMQIQGISTTLELHRAIFDDADFQRGEITTNFLDRFLLKP